jgi:hypothetical protein
MPLELDSNRNLFRDEQFHVFNVLGNKHSEVDAEITSDAGVSILFVKKGMALMGPLFEAHDPGVFSLVEFE